MQLGGYEVKKKIGQGGMATVYKGVQTSLERPVALKVLKKTLLDREDVKSRFERESLIIARLKHPNIIDVIDRGISPKGQPYFVMAYVQGRDLKELIKKGSLAMPKRIHISVQICKALAYAHDNGVIHRDIKPANILIDGRNQAYVLDFGIAHFCEETKSTGSKETHQTQVGDVMGTAAYMAPEIHASADNASVQSDLYAFGVLFYELLTGVLPVGRFELPSTLNPKIPKVIDSIIESCLSPDESKRPRSASQIKNTLLKVMRGAHLAPEQKERAQQAVSKSEDKFSLLDIIKEDKFGAVYLFEDKTHRELLVIKKRANSNEGYRENKLLSTLQHANIVKVKGVSKNERVFISVMEYLSGGCLQDRLVTPFRWKSFISVATQMCEAMDYAHRNQIIHGNLRPRNILFTDKGRVKISDFGFDEHYGEGEEGGNWYNFLGEVKSVKADIYAGGAIFYQMLTSSQRPPEWKQGKLRSSTQFDALPSSLREVILKMMALDSGQRYGTFSEVLADLKSVKVSAQPVKTAKRELRTLDDVKSRALSQVALFSVLLFMGTSASVYYTGNGPRVFGIIQAELYDLFFRLEKFVELARELLP